MEAWVVECNNAPLVKVERPTPVPTGTEVLIEVTHAGVCHSDLHFWEGCYNLGGGKKMLLAERGVKLPRAMGHEILGRVAALGPDATGVQVGDRRIVYPWIGCGECRQCRIGQSNLCSKQRTMGVMQDGGYASHILLPDSGLLVDPGDVDPAVASTFGCSGITVLNAIRKIMPLDPSDPVVLIGAGGLGLAAIAMLRALGHQKIVTVDIDPLKRQAALDGGATDVVDGTLSDLTAAIVEAAGAPIYGVLDFVNGSATARAAFDVLAKGGRAIQVGIFGGELTLSLNTFIFKGTGIMGSVTGTLADLHEVASLARSGKLAPIPVVRMPKHAANEALCQLRDGKVTGRIVLTAEAV